MRSRINQKTIIATCCCSPVPRPNPLTRKLGGVWARDYWSSLIGEGLGTRLGTGLRHGTTVAVQVTDAPVLITVDMHN